MGSVAYSLQTELDFPAGDPFSPPGVIDQRELEQLAARRSVTGRAGHGSWQPALIQGDRSGEPGEVRTGSVLPGPRRSGRPRVIHARALVRIGLAAAIMAALLVVFSIPRAGADRGPVPAASHTVQPGDTLWSIAELYTPATGDVRATVALIRSANEESSGLLAVGDVIEVPLGEIPGAPSNASG